MTRVTFATQQLKYNQVNWSPANGANGGEEVDVDSTGFVRTFSGLPAGHVHSSKPHFEFTASTDATSGLKISDVVVRNTQSTGSTEPVYNLIEFADFEVTFSDGTQKTVDIRKALANETAVLSIAENGKLGTDDLYQRGLHLLLHDDLDGECAVTLELCVVFRGDTNDGDPAGAFDGLKIYPQIGFQWTRGGKPVAGFRGSVKMEIATVMPPGHLGGSGNVASFYTDSNSSLDMLDFRNKSSHYVTLVAGGTYVASRLAAYAAAVSPGLAPLLPLAAMIAALWGLRRFPDWAIIFDYCLPDIQEEIELKGVFGPLDGNNANGDSYFSDTRKENYDWPSNSGYSIGVKKFPRQGNYDNLHVHGRMATGTRLGDEKVHAPFCVHSCFHFHWRWSELNTEVATVAFHPDVGVFKGWGKSLFQGWRSAHEPGATLIPPNQSLTITVADPSATRDPSTGRVASAGAALDSGKKTVWYTVDIQSSDKFPFRAGQKQVILEQGTGWAYQLASVRTPPGISAMQISMFFDFFYDLIRYFDGDLGYVPDEIGQQIPEGTYDENGGHTPMAEL